MTSIIWLKDVAVIEGCHPDTVMRRVRRGVGVEPDGWEGRSPWWDNEESYRERKKAIPRRLPTPEEHERHVRDGRDGILCRFMRSVDPTEPLELADNQGRLELRVGFSSEVLATFALG